MGKYKAPLSALAVSKIRAKGLHFVGGVPNLALNVTTSGTRSWILRYRLGGRTREMGLGAYPEVSLAEGRGMALLNRKLLRDGIDPIAAKQERGIKHAEDSVRRLTFSSAAQQYIESRRSGWKSVKHADQWQQTLQTFAFPIIGNLPVRNIALDHILKVIEPIWTTRTETANRVRGRIEVILDWAKVRGYREGDNPATWKGNLDTILPPRSKVSKVKHHAALAWEKCPEFFSRLRNNTNTGSLALKFCILTACRSGEVRGAQWSEIDLEKAVWTIPAERMKAGREHRVPLSKPAIELLRNTPRFVDEALVFSGSHGKVLSDMTLLKQLRDMNETFTVHGFRSSFRDWAGESTRFPREVIEHALAHQLKDKAEAAYARGDLFTKRIELMRAWAAYLTSSSGTRGSRT